MVVVEVLLGLVLLGVAVAVKLLFTVAALDLQAAEEFICISAFKRKDDREKGSNRLVEWRGCW